KDCIKLFKTCGRFLSRAFLIQPGWGRAEIPGQPHITYRAITFFRPGVMGHISLASPVGAVLSCHVYDAARGLNLSIPPRAPTKFCQES
ncbi:MAG: hypothetical protein ACPLRR_02360, partial [Candidatus Saccharicenans sp.]